MQNYVNFVDGKFYLSISPEMAKAYGVSDELYNQYVEHVRDSNEQVKQ
jgi:hypothetical protein